MDGYEKIWIQLEDMFNDDEDLATQGQWMIKIKYKYDDEEEYDYSWEYISYSYDTYMITWEKDWNEGQTDCELIAVLNESKNEIVWRLYQL